MELLSTAPNTDQSSDARLKSLLAKLTLEEKVQLLTGRDFWTTWPIEKIGLRRMLFSDGPTGVRGEVWDERQPSMNFPSAAAISSSWDPAIADRLGAASAVEARRKGVDVVLGPTINLHRSPLGGRHFEAFSEDPVLTAELAAAYVSGVQRNGVGATPKHYIANDSETDRFAVDVKVGDRPLRELYLLAFEKAIVESKAWLVMSAYNSINGATATENELLETPLNSEWGFDGVVISDWTAVRSINSANASQDLAMPGPDGPWGEALVVAVKAGQVPEAAIDRKVLRILQLAARVGALEGFDAVAAEPADREDPIAFAREVSAAGTVMVKNDGVLPLDPASVKTVAVIGHNARYARTQGGGSATVIPAKIVTPLDGIRAAFGSDNVTYSVGAVVQEGIAELPLEQLTNPVTGTPGVRVRFLDANGEELFAEDRRSTALVWFGGDAPIAASSMVQFHTIYTPDETGTVRLGFSTVGHGRIFVNGILAHEATVEAVGTDLGAALLAPPAVSVPVKVCEGIPMQLRVELTTDSVGALSNTLGITIGVEAYDADPDSLIKDAVEAARAAEIAVVVVGTNSRVESEGYDRTSLELPGQQDRLVHAVAGANPRTIVIVNSGSPVLMPWRNEVAAILIGYFGGQEFGHALTDILTGATEPGGRLPTTWPATQEDVPVLNVTPAADGTLTYDEGIHIGYRAWLKAGTTPAYEFGYGLGYTTWTTDSVDAPAETTPGAVVPLSVALTNTGARAGKNVVQVYAEKPGSAVDRPVRWLVASTPVRAEAGETTTATLEVPTRLLAYWDNGWTYEPGNYTLRIGTSVTDLPLQTTLELVQN
ncbi:glycoside hydrolase family 3 C-terminal domain-containing protein [Pseudarthrobacter sp. MDT3-28]|uniref:beta-glucosidase family protein n=1 Tax=Pseudarthrobacter raffinosi TaxID=2953651 RepID=UPI00208E9CD4|nr:glycoside hydrolase family 3 C-terminal domain-containing protein [Pseudarthrobacter sp. MDT3-28]MCO4239301.1 glycoside hydrolase family 3 C-terminal domain-containing protein [Pseudarthrobacter sp. MDT3-28]